MVRTEIGWPCPAVGKGQEVVLEAQCLGVSGVSPAFSPSLPMTAMLCRSPSGVKAKRVRLPFGSVTSGLQHAVVVVRRWS